MRRDLTGPRARPSSTQLIARILDTPNLAAAVQALPAPVLARLIDALGLEDAGEIIAFANPAQLAEVFDEDLWRSERAGGDEQFDGDRFLVWLEVMMEAGDAFVADRLASLPEDLVALALHEHVLVLDVDELLAEMQGTDDEEAIERVEKALSNCLSEEIDRYQLVSRRHDGWDAVLAAVLALDRDHPALLARMLERLSAMTAEYVDREGGLHGALTSEEMLEADVAADREDRRAALGYVAPSDARAFLKLVEQPITDLPKEHDPVTRAYFRGLGRPAPAARRTPAAPRSAEPSSLARLLLDAGVAVYFPSATPLLGAGARSEREPLLVRTMRDLAEVDPAAFAARSEEMAYLANVLIAGASLDGRRYRPAEAVEKAIDVCSRGLEIAAKGGEAVAVLREYPAEGLFRIAWARA
ncbi:MAG: DUF6178 family protein [Polyangiaceae bacterium]|nr:DUF6178 family protein [Polyangiaceae bacterium]